MSKLMSVLGIVLLAIGVALTLVGFVNPAQVQIYGISLETAALLLVGGILSIGLGGVIAALEGRGGMAVVDTPVAEETSAVIEAPAPDVADAEEAASSEEPKRIRFPGFGRKIVATTVAAAATETVVETSKSSVQDTIDALEQAKSDINNALGGMATATTPAADVEDGVIEEDDAATGEELYVVEEKTIRGRPARMLSDNTVEAETDEGWMRFEDMDHLNEYLDAAGEPA